MNFNDKIYDLLSDKDATFIKLKYPDRKTMFKAFLDYFNVTQEQIHDILGDGRIEPMFVEFCKDAMSEKKLKHSITAKAVRELREAKGISMHEAKMILVRENLSLEVCAAETVEDLKSVLLAILEDNVL